MFELPHASSPILLDELTHATWTPLDLSAPTLRSKGIDPTDNDALQRYISHGHIRYGGYLEQRSVYQRSAHFGGQEARDIHLGLDIWTTVGTAVRALWSAEVYGLHDNDGLGDYGPTVVLKHSDGLDVWFSLYGHLSRESLSTLTLGGSLSAGDTVGTLGSQEENGGWPPHLHLQLIHDMEGQRSDYPGVCRSSQLDHYRNNCPDPWSVLLEAKSV